MSGGDYIHFDNVVGQLEEEIDITWGLLVYSATTSLKR